MATIKKMILSESSFGRNIVVSGVNSGQLTTIHTAVGGGVDLDEVYLYAYNSQIDDVDLTVYWGEVSQFGEMKVSIPYQAGRYMFVDGKILQSGLPIKAFCSSGYGINIDGYVNRFDY